MITKREYAISVVNEFRVRNKIDKNAELKDYIKYTYSSTSLGLALVILGVINEKDHPQEFEYLQNRAGVHSIYIPTLRKDPKYMESSILTERELYDLLPGNPDYDPFVDGFISLVRIYRDTKDSSKVNADITLETEKRITIDWGDDEERFKYLKGLDDNSLIIDERTIKKS